MTDINQPTPEQLKKFWEWCGFKAEYHNADLDRNIGKGHIVTGFWRDPISLLLIPMNGLVKTIPLDLNNLFKYAVPKVLRFHLQRGYPDRELFQAEIDYTADGGDGFTCHQAEHRVPALALFWAIWEVIK